MKPRRSLVTGGVAALICSNAIGYDVRTHFDLSQASATIAISDATLQNLGLRSLAAGQTFPAGDGMAHPDFLGVDTNAPSQKGCAHNAPFTAVDLIACGSMFEDVPELRSLNHFFDPQHLDSAGRPRSLTALIPLFHAPWNSADWALRDDPNNSPDDSAQQFSYKDARNYFYGALTKTASEGARQAQWGLMFQSLGQVIHHIQDMAQPQHTRNDAHLDILGGYDVVPITNVSRYEKRPVENRDVAELVRQYAASAAAVFPAYATLLRSPRSFWANNGAGMAEYSSLNFVSEGTNFRMQNGVAGANVNFSAPQPAGSQDMTMAQLVNDPTFLPSTPTPFVIQQCGANLTGCKVTMYKTIGQDPLTGAALVNNYASTYSVFDQDLAAYGKFIRTPNPDTGDLYVTERAFSINRYNIDAAYKFLIPKAAGYSAGLINYFFRGQMEISLPDDGVYAIVDHTPDDTTPAGCGTPCGFRKIKLKLKNMTPNDDMTAGDLVVVAKYHLNNCYRTDLSGEFGAPAFAGPSCRPVDEFIVVSNTNANQTVGRVAQALDFTFPDATPIPINATDLYLQVIYKGKLGLEDGAVAVTTIDMHEPTFLTFGNHNDYQAIYNTDGTFSSTTPYEPPGRFSLNIEIRFNPAQPSAIAASTQLDPGDYHRVAVLTDQPTVDYSLAERYLSTPTFDTENWSTPSTVNQTDDQGQTVNAPHYVTLRHTTTTDWAYTSDQRGSAIYWLPPYLCVNGTDNCNPVDKTVDAIARRYPPFTQPTPKPISISF